MSSLDPGPVLVPLPCSVEVVRVGEQPQPSELLEPQARLVLEKEK